MTKDQSPPVPDAALSPICLPPDDTDVKLVLEATLPRCPFCNGTPTTFSRYFEHSGIYQSYVNCSWCPAQVFVNSRDRGDARAHAIEAWGKRVAATHITTLEAEVEALRKALGKTQWELETIDRTNSTNMAKVRELIVANRKALLERRKP